ncbi:hypothetical protein BC936DRAFT_149020 [Jimgerdemannia flammicorona]|uniref:Uncharacterized protein n=1 Tax=Jimgerdemannia flammicorona TaxID=994334 RepID=A0A433D1R4_9FUNG|nr:hypothetical protein BC936DRAFT_149020 [Jimgerdemannia flammicorona]
MEKGPPSPLPPLPMIEIPSDPSRLVTDLIDNPQYGKHLGWIMAQRSASALRSHNNPTIMLVGLSGAGKSTTINRLFDSEICKNWEFQFDNKKRHRAFRGNTLFKKWYQQPQAFRHRYTRVS